MQQWSKLSFRPCFIIIIVSCAASAAKAAIIIKEYVADASPRKYHWNE